MRICEICNKQHIKKIWHPYKDFRCTNCCAEYKYHRGNKFDSISNFIVGFSTEILFSIGVIALFLIQIWFVFFIIIVTVLLLVAQILKFKYSKLELTGLYEKTRKKSL